MSHKRSRLQPQSAESLRNELVALYSELDADFLWDPSKMWKLLRPTVSFDHNLSPWYEYIGRERAKLVYDAVSSMTMGRHMQVLGAKGTGKSIVVSTISGYLIGSGQGKVVYVSVKRYVEVPFFVLQQALLLASADASLSEMATLDELVSWCYKQEWGSLLFVADDWDHFEKLDASCTLLATLISASTTHSLIKVSSVNSRDRQIWSESDKADDDIATVFFDGPYTTREMETWIAQSRLTVEQLQHVDRLTGGIPRLLRFYEETKGNEKAFLGKIKGTYTMKLFKKFIGQLKTQSQLRAALHLVLYGELGAELGPGLVDFTCFYMDEEGVFHLLSPYLRNQAEYYIMEHHGNLQCSLVYNDICIWSQAVLVDCEIEGSRNPARIGWNIEALVIAVMRYRKNVFGFQFRHYRTYAHGCEATALNRLTVQELQEGVLLGPEAFNEKAVDVVYIILVGKVLCIKAVQITVAQWKLKAKKESHKIWRDEVLPKWTSAKRKLWTVEQEFYYIMPQSVHLQDASARFRRLGDVDDCLAQFDDLLDVKEPAMLDKGAIQQCSGMKSNGECCHNKGRVFNGPYYCHHHRIMKD